MADESDLESAPPLNLTLRGGFGDEIGVIESISCTCMTTIGTVGEVELLIPLVHLTFEGEEETFQFSKTIHFDNLAFLLWDTAYEMHLATRQVRSLASGDMKVSSQSLARTRKWLTNCQTELSKCLGALDDISSIDAPTASDTSET
jgi:hypothetical protein